MATLASLLVVMGMDTKALTAGAAKAEGSLAGLGVSAKTLGSVVPLAAAAAGAGVVAFAAHAVGAARDLVESTNKVKVVFGDSAQEVLDWSKTTADSFGISEQAALESASTMGNLFDAMGLASDAGVEMSTTLVELASDLASFNNAVDVKDVLAALQSGLTGQIRPLRQFGIEISDAALKQEALAQGIDKSTAQMTMAEKVQLRYALIMKQSGNAQGDFARTSGDLANVQRRLTAQWETLTARLGMFLLPAVLDVTSALNDMATVVLFLTGATEGFTPKVKEAAINTAEWELGIASWAERVTGHIPIIGTFVSTVQDVSAAVSAAGDSTKLTQDQLDTLAMHIIGQSTAYEGLRAHWRGVADDFLGFVDLTKEHVPEIERQMAKIPEAFRDTADAVIGEIPKIRGTITTYKETFTLSAADLVKITESWAKIARTIASDLRAIGKSDLEPAMREAISALPPEMRHAWVEGNQKERNAIEQSIRETFRIEDSIPALVRQALTGGHDVGSAFASGIGSSIAAGSSSIAVAASQAVQAAIVAARAAAESHSPSKVMMRLGDDLMAGLEIGITEGMGSVADALASSIQMPGSGGPATMGGYVAGPVAAEMPTMAGGITVNVYGDVTGEEIVRKVRDGLLKVGNRNAGTGL